MIYYYIITGDPTEQQWLDAIENEATARCSLDETKIVLKTDGLKESFGEETPYSHSEILVIMQTQEWQEIPAGF